MYVSIEPPTAVRNLRVTDTTSNSITLQWDPPFRTGRQDYYYVVEYSDPDDIARYIRHNTNNLTSTFYTLDHVRSVTTYLIRVSVHNSVSDQDAQNADRRVVEIYARTEEGRKIFFVHHIVHTGRHYRYVGNHQYCLTSAVVL